MCVLPASSTHNCSLCMCASRLSLKPESVFWLLHHSLSESFDSGPQRLTNADSQLLPYRENVTAVCVEDFFATDQFPVLIVPTP